MANPVDDAGNVRVDHVWGNLPMQPNDARGAAVLDYALDNHVIVETGRYGFPAYDASWVGDGDDVPNVKVPDVRGLDETAAGAALVAAGLVLGTVGTTATGATAENDGLVKTQSVAPGTSKNQGDAVNVVVYAYVAP